MWWAASPPVIIKPNNRPCGRWKSLPPLVAGATTFATGKRVAGFSVAQGLPTNPVTCFPVEEVPRSGIGGGERSEPISRMFIMPYDTGRQSRNAGSFLKKELGEALRNTERFWADCQSAAFPPTGIYYRLSHKRLELRAFCIECASRPKLALSLPIKGPSF